MPVDDVSRFFRSATTWALEPLRDLRRVVTLRWRDARLVIGGAAQVADDALPLATDGVDGVALLLALPHVAHVDALFAELRRVLRPAGTLVVVVPSLTLRSADDLRWRAVLGPVRRGPWRHRSALDGAGWLLAAADFAVLADDRKPFIVPVPDADCARRAVDALVRSGAWPPVADVTDRVAGRAGPGRGLPVPLRRLVARR